MNFTPFTTSKKAAVPNNKYPDSFCLLNIASTPTNDKGLQQIIAQPTTIFHFD